MDSHALAYPLYLGMRTPMLWRGILRGAYGVPRFLGALGVGDMDSHTFGLAS